MYYRYEIVDNLGKSYGLFTGLSIIGLEENHICEITEEFEKYLPIPMFYWNKGKNGKKDVFAYFTEYGKDRFRKCIENIIKIVENNGFTVIIKEQTNVGSRRLVYEDKYQVLIKKK